MLYGDFKDLHRRTITNKILHDKAFNIAKISNCDGYQHKLASMVYNFFNRQTSNANKEAAVKSVIVSENKEITKELHKLVIRKIEKRKLHRPFIDNISGADMHLLSEFNKGIRFWLCVIDVFSKYACIVPLNNK